MFEEAFFWECGDLRLALEVICVLIGIRISDQLGLSR